MRSRRLAGFTGAFLLAIAAVGIAGAAPAAADQVWHQSVARASSDAACPTSSAADIDAGWTEWAATWEAWPNDGTGGWTCARSITWAKDSQAPEDSAGLSGCVQTNYDDFLITGPVDTSPNGLFYPTSDGSCGGDAIVEGTWVQGPDQEYAEFACFVILGGRFITSLGAVPVGGEVPPGNWFCSYAIPF